MTISEMNEMAGARVDFLLGEGFDVSVGTPYNSVELSVSRAEDIVLARADAVILYAQRSSVSWSGLVVLDLSEQNPVVSYSPSFDSLMGGFFRARSA